MSSASHSSTVWSRFSAHSPLLNHAPTSSSQYPSRMAWCAYAAMPFIPNKSVERRETMSVSPFQSSTASYTPPPIDRRSARTRSVNARIAASSKLTLVSVVNRPSAMRLWAVRVRFPVSSTASAKRINSYTSSSCKRAVSGCFPQTPVRTQPLLPAVCWH